MPRNNISRIREKIRLGQYDMTAHAMEEMAEDGLDIIDVELVMLSGKITQIEKDDSRGTKYVIEGVAKDGFTRIGIVGRFTSKNYYLIITIYEITAI